MVSRHRFSAVYFKLDGMSISPLAIPLALIFGWLAHRMLRDVRRARERGVTEFLFQWPDGIPRETRPVAFWWLVTVCAAVGYIFALGAAVLLIGAIVNILGGFSN